MSGNFLWTVESADLCWDSGSNLRTKLEKAFEPLGIRAPLRKPSSPVPDKLVRALGGNPRKLRERFVAMDVRLTRGMP